MKQIIIVLFFLSFLFNTYADDKYSKAMKQNLEKFDSAKTVEQYLTLSNNFERIASAEKDKWLPYYYASMLNILASFAEQDKEKKDTYLDKSEMLLSIADSLQPNESEIYTLKGLLGQARMQVDPMNRWMKYGPEADRNFKKAVELDSLNPRPEYLIGVGLFYTPEQFGGGPKVAKPVLEKSLEKYNSFVSKGDFMPNWGRKQVEELLEQMKEH